MATVRSGSGDLDMFDFDFGDYLDGRITKKSSTELRVRDEDSSTVLKGTGLTFDKAGEMTGGTITSIAAYDEGRAEASFSGIKISAREFQRVSDSGSERDDAALLAKMLGGSDRIVGGRDDDELRGFAGNDRIEGGADSDRLYGDAGDDRLFGGSGNDRLYGGTGADTLEGGSGADRLYGGEGDVRDTFLFTAGSSGGSASRADTIHDFDRKNSAGEKVWDRIDVKALDVAWADVDLVRDGGSLSVRIDTNDNGRADFFLNVANVTKLSADDFIF